MVYHATVWAQQYSFNSLSLKGLQKVRQRHGDTIDLGQEIFYTRPVCKLPRLPPSALRPEDLPVMIATFRACGLSPIAGFKSMRRSKIEGGYVEDQEDRVRVCR
jgi:hypothetical protein